MSCERQLRVSTDVVGMIPDVDLFEQIWGSNPKNIEVIGWSYFIPGFLEVLTRMKHQVCCIHGRTQGKEKISYLKSIMCHHLLCRTEKLLGLSSEYEILVHCSEASDVLIPELKAKGDSFNPKLVWIENGYSGPEGIDEACNSVLELSKMGMNSGVMIDLAHFFGFGLLTRTYNGDGKEFEEKFKDLITYLSDFFSKSKNLDLNLGFHFPVGTEVGDSLPISFDGDKLNGRLSEGMVRDFAQVISGQSVGPIVLESQYGIGHVLNPWRNVYEIRRRHEDVVNTMVKCGIFGNVEL